MTRDEIERAARDLYAVYCASSDGKNYQGLVCPTWDSLPPNVRAHWCAVARRAVQLGNGAVEPDAYVLFGDDGLEDRLTRAVEVWRSYSGRDA